MVDKYCFSFAVENINSLERRKNQLVDVGDKLDNNLVDKLSNS